MNDRPKSPWQPPHRYQKQSIMPVVFIMSYLLLAIFTFGHAFNRFKNDWDAVSSALFCAGFAPLYWSVVLQEKNDGK